jgi:hypothetical protein
LGSITLALIVVAAGWASHYDPNVMERTVAVRQRIGHLPENLDWEGGYIALLEPDLIGQEVLVCKEHSCRWVLVVDCAGHADGGYAWMVRNGIAGELDYRTATEMQTHGHKITVYLPIMRKFIYE